MRWVLPSRSDATSVLLCKASIRYLFAWKEIKPAREKGKTERKGVQPSRRFQPFLDSSPRWFATVQLDQARRYARCTLHRICTDDSSSLHEGRGRRSARRRRQERKEIALWKILARLKPEFNTVQLMVTIPNRRERAHWTNEFLFTVHWRIEPPTMHSCVASSERSRLLKKLVLKNEVPSSEHFPVIRPGLLSWLRLVTRARAPT